MIFPDLLLILLLYYLLTVFTCFVLRLYQFVYIYLPTFLCFVAKSYHAFWRDVAQIEAGMGLTVGGWHHTTSLFIIFLFDHTRNCIISKFHMWLHSTLNTQLNKLREKKNWLFLNQWSVMINAMAFLVFSAHLITLQFSLHMFYWLPQPTPISHKSLVYCIYLYNTVRFAN